MKGRKGEKMKEAQRDAINTFFVDTFNRILSLEEHALSKGDISDLSVKELHIIEAVCLLEQDGHNTMSEIAAKVGITVGALTTAVNVLVKKGYLKRNRSDKDRRIVRMFLTEKGRHAEIHHRVFHENMIAYVEQALNDEEIDKLIYALKQLSCFFSGL